MLNPPQKNKTKKTPRSSPKVSSYNCGDLFCQNTHNVDEQRTKQLSGVNKKVDI